jgi:alpha-N-acetylglucosaminidase
MSEIQPVFQIFDGYYGQPFIWCMLHNFGGVLGLIGSFKHLNKVNTGIFVRF